MKKRVYITKENMIERMIRVTKGIFTLGLRFNMGKIVWKDCMERLYGKIVRRSNNQDEGANAPKFLLFYGISNKIKIWR